MEDLIAGEKMRDMTLSRAVKWNKMQYIAQMTAGERVNISSQNYICTLQPAERGDKKIFYQPSAHKHGITIKPAEDILSNNMMAPHL